MATLTLAEVTQIYLDLYGSDIGIASDAELDGVYDFYIQDGDFQLVGIREGDAVKDKIADIAKLVIQVILAFMLTSIDPTTGETETGITQNEALGSPLAYMLKNAVWNSDDQLALVDTAIKAVIVQHILSTGMVADITKLDGYFDDSNRQLTYDIEVRIPTGEVVNLTVSS